MSVLETQPHVERRAPRRESDPVHLTALYRPDGAAVSFERSTEVLWLKRADSYTDEAGSRTSGRLLFRGTYSAHAFLCNEQWAGCTNQFLLEGNGRGIIRVVVSVYERRVAIERHGLDDVYTDDFGRVRELEGTGWIGFKLGGGRFLQITDGEAFLFSEPDRGRGEAAYHVMEAMYSLVN